MPSSLVQRIRIVLAGPSRSISRRRARLIRLLPWWQTRPGRGENGRSREAALIGLLDHLQAAHVRLQYFRHSDRPVFLLVGFHDRDQRAANRGARTVQRMHEAGLAVASTVSRIHAPRLEFAA